MGLDNYIHISRKTIAVNEYCLSDGRKLSRIGKGNGIDEAIDIAQKFVKESGSEGEIVFSDK